MTDFGTHDHKGTSRRTVVRTAAHAAWLVPTIQIAAIAPAFANSTINDIQDPKLTVAPTGDNKIYTVGLMSVDNDGPSPLPANGVRLTITSSSTINAVTVSAGSNWVVFSGVGTKTVILRYNAAVPVSVPSTADQSLAGTITVTQQSASVPTAILSYLAP